LRTSTTKKKKEEKNAKGGFDEVEMEGNAKGGFDKLEMEGKKTSQVTPHSSLCMKW
jgi:hypothetical protein